jgi:hypothetical protein
MEKAEGSRSDRYGNERNQSSESTTSRRGSALDSKEHFEHGTRQSEMTRGMAESSERGFSHESGRQSGSGRGGGSGKRELDEERNRQNRGSERGRSQEE